MICKNYGKEIKNSTKTIIFFIVICILYISLIIMNFNNKTAIYDLDTVVKEELEQKYSEKLVYVSKEHFQNDPQREFWYEFKVDNENSPIYEKIINVRVNYFDSRTKEIDYEDNYISVKYKDHFQKLIIDNIKEYFKEYDIYYNVSAGDTDKNFDKNTTFEDYLLQNDGMIFSIITIKESDFKGQSQIEDFARKFNYNINRNYDLSLLVLNDNYYDKRELEEIRTFLMKNTYDEIIYNASIHSYNDDFKVNINKKGVIVPKYRKKTKEYLENTAKEYLDEIDFKINGLSDYIDEDPIYLNDNITFEEFLREYNKIFYIDIEMNLENYTKENLEKLINKYINDGLEFKIFFSACNVSDTNCTKCTITKDINQEVIYDWTI